MTSSSHLRESYLTASRQAFIKHCNIGAVASAFGTCATALLLRFEKKEKLREGSLSKTSKALIA